MAYTIYTKEGAQAANPSYFKRLPQSSPGPQRTPLGHALPVLRADYSFIVVRVGHKVQRQVYYTDRTQARKVKDYHATARTDYIVATINWDTGFITELATHPDRASADADMRARHRAQ